MTAPTLNPTWERVSGDTGDTLAVYIEGIADLSVVSAVTCHIRKVDSTTVVNLAGAITDIPNKIAVINLGSWITTALGDYEFQVELTTTSGPVTLPSSGFCKLKVGPGI